MCQRWRSMLALYRDFFCKINIPLICSQFNESARGQDAVAVLERRDPNSG